MSISHIGYIGDTSDDISVRLFSAMTSRHYYPPDCRFRWRIYPSTKVWVQAANLNQHDGCHVLQFRQDVRTGAFPAKEHTYGMIEGGARQAQDHAEEGCQIQEVERGFPFTRPGVHCPRPFAIAAVLPDRVWSCQAVAIKSSTTAPSDFLVRPKVSPSMVR